MYRAAGLGSGGGLPFLTSPPLFVNATTGNDNNDGLTSATALLTLRELGRRYYGRILTAGATISVVGNFLEPLFLETAGPPGAILRVNGDTPTIVGSGTLTGASQAYSAAANTDCRITDGVQAWAGLVNARIRFTSGAASGAMAWVLADLGAGVARIGQLVSPTTGNMAALPGIGDAYVVETLTTKIAGFRVRLGGGLRFDGRDLNDHLESNDQLVQYLVASGQIAQTTDQAPQCRLVGCKFENAVIAASQAHNITQSHVGFIATHSQAVMRFSHSRLLINSHSFTQSFGANGGSRFDVQAHLVGQGASVTVFSFACIQLTTDGAGVAAGIATYGAAGAACLDINASANVVGVIAGNTLFGTGNTSTQSCRVRSSGSFNYLTTPTITGPAIDCLLGGVATAWAAIAAAPQASITNANNGATAGAMA